MADPLEGRDALDALNLDFLEPEKEPKKKKKKRQGSPGKKQSKRKRDKKRQKEKEEEKKILSRMNDIQKARYKAYMEEKLDKEFVRGIITSLLEDTKEKVGKNKAEREILCLVIRDVTQLFVGDIVEESRQVMEEWGDTGPIRPVHMREAHRRIDNLQNKNIRSTGRLFGRR
mmetsp:Transcript_1991/g.2831  ORF Transcript_1991/g.2831 Transcript_1991/m.2831 type:complete len:172 (-) Transcript_1991:159-674(-)